MTHLQSLLRDTVDTLYCVLCLSVPAIVLAALGMTLGLYMSGAIQ